MRSLIRGGMSFQFDVLQSSVLVDNHFDHRTLNRCNSFRTCGETHYSFAVYHVNDGFPLNKCLQSCTLCYDSVLRYGVLCQFTIVRASLKNWYAIAFKIKCMFFVVSNCEAVAGNPIRNVDANVHQLLYICKQRG